ncbi:hypothetical protein [Brasilonema sp. UFV-L1]|nr:hypothetical protein [Brasilonema sp. UFV-L1]
MHDFIYCSGVATIAAVGAAVVVTTFLVSPLAAGMFALSGLTYALQRKA